MYADLIKSKLNNDEDKKIFVKPNIPAVKLGKALMNDTRIESPADVVACHFVGGFLSSDVVILTDTKLFFDDGMCLLEELKGAQADGKKIKVSVNHLGSLSDFEFKTNSDESAALLVKVLDDIIYFDAEEAGRPEKTYEGFDGAELDWLKLRDEVMKTIDMLQEKFNDGKLSLLEWEEKKAELLSRL